MCNKNGLSIVIYHDYKFCFIIVNMYVMFHGILSLPEGREE